MKRILTILFLLPLFVSAQFFTTDETTRINAGLVNLSAPTISTPTVISSTEIDLTWSAPSHAAGYILQQAAYGSSSWSTIYTGSSTSRAVTGLSASTHYQWRVLATASGFNPSAYSTANDASTTSGVTGSTTPMTYSSAVYAGYDMTDATQLTNDGGGLISSVTDKSGNGHTLTSSGSNRPTLTTGGQNGKSYLNMAAFKTLTGTATLSQPFTIYWVVKQKAYNIIAEFNSANSLNISNFSNAFGVYTVGAQGGSTSFSTRSSLYPFFIGSPTFAWDGSAIRPRMFKFEFDGDSSSVRVDLEPQSARTEVGGGTSGMTKISINAEGSSIDSYELWIFNRRLTRTEDSALMVDYFYPKYQTPNTNYIAFTGNSITQGVGASTPANQFTNLVASELGLTQYNYGISGAFLHQTAGDYNKGWDDEVYNACGIYNDGILISNIGYNNDWVPTTWKADYKATIQYAISKGYAANKIYLFSPIHSLTAYSGSNSNMDLQAADIQAIASELGCNYGDLLHYSRAHTSSYTMPDGVHPDDNGHRLIANYIESVIAGSPLTIDYTPSVNYYVNARGELKHVRTIETLKPNTYVTYNSYRRQVKQHAGHNESLPK